jgi:hypothetical protein
MARTDQMSGAPTRGGTGQKQDNGKGRQTAPVPFVRASVEHRESAGYDVSTLQTTSTITLPDVVVPAYGYLRSILLVVTCSGGAGTSVTKAEDGPFNILSNIILQEPNGAQIANFPSGYDLYLANKFGGYWHHNEPKQDANYAVGIGSGMNVSFVMRVPVEVCLRDAVGALPNQNSGAQFRLKMNLAPAATVFGGTLTTPPTVRIRAYTECWDQPEDSTDGRPNQTVPPALNTTQYWTRQDFTVNSGQNTIRLTRVGNLLRNVLFCFRSSSARSTGATNWADPLTVYYDTRPLDTVTAAMWASQQRERYGYINNIAYSTSAVAGTPIAADSAGGVEAGVFPLDFAHEFGGFVGRELRDLWLPTLSSTRLEVQGTFGAAGVLTVLTNDVTISDNVWL